MHANFFRVALKEQ